MSVSSPCVLLEAQRTHTHTHKLHSDTLCSRSSSFFRYLATSYFLSFPGSFSGPAGFFSFRHSLGHFFLSSLLLCFLSSPIQVNHPIVYLMKGTAVFFFSLSFTYSRLTVLLQRHSFAPNKEIIQRVQKTAFRERCLAGDLLLSLLLNLYCGLSFGQHMLPSSALRQHVRQR